MVFGQRGGLFSFFSKHSVNWFQLGIGFVLISTLGFEAAATGTSKGRGKSAPAVESAQSGTAETTATASACEPVLSRPRKSYPTLAEIANLNVTENHPVVLHPFTIMNSWERTNAIGKFLPPVAVKKPLFGVGQQVVYPVFHRGLAEADHRLVVGQESSVSAFMSAAGSRANGEKMGIVVGMPGPPGTGKTEIGYIVTALSKNLGKSDSRFRTLSFQWRNLHEIPFLRPLVGLPMNADPKAQPTIKYLAPPMLRSPFTLLREQNQASLLQVAGPKIRQVAGMTVTEGWTEPDPWSKAILQALLEHYFPDFEGGRGTQDDLTDEEYAEFLKHLDHHIVVVDRENIAKDSIGNRIVFNPQTGDYNEAHVTGETVIANAYHYGANHVFAFDFAGAIPRADGGVLLFDELFRNEISLRERLLNLFQNSVLQVGSHSVKLDLAMVWNANDESLAAANSRDANKALNDRSVTAPMRLNLDPVEIESVIPFQVGMNVFRQQKIGGELGDIEPFRFTEIYKTSDSGEQKVSAHGRYAFYYHSDGRNVRFAPFALQYLSWFVSATRLEFNPSKLNEHSGRFTLISQNQGQIVDPLYRMNIILGRIVPDRPALLTELDSMVDLLVLGSDGFSARDVEKLFKSFIFPFVNERERANITPTLVDAMITKYLNKEAGKVSPVTRDKYDHLRQRVRLEMLLPALNKEVNMIISGDGARSEKMYDQIVEELLEQAAHPGAKEVTEIDGHPRVINTERLRKIRELYVKKWNRDLNMAYITQSLRHSGTRGQTRDPQLLQVIEEFIAATDALTQSWVTQLREFYDGGNKNPSVAEKAAEIDLNLASYGYDRESFAEAVRFVVQMDAEKAKHFSSQSRQ